MQYDFVVIREYFPSKNKPTLSPWVYEQVKGCLVEGLKPHVLSPVPYRSKWFRKISSYNNRFFIAGEEIDEYDGVSIDRIRYIKLPGSYFFHRNIRVISRLISKRMHSMDIKFIHAHFGHAGAVCLNIAKKKEIPLITSFYGFDLGSDKLRLHQYYLELSEQGCLFLALSNDMKADLISLGFPEGRIIVHHLGIDTELFDVSNVDFLKDDFTFLIVASFEKRKGIDIAIKAFLHLADIYKNSKIKLKIVGNGPEFQALLRIAKSCKKIEFIDNFATPNPRQIVLEEMKKCDVLLLTSILLPNGEKEGTPVVLMEAQSCGKPCIGTRHAGIPEVIEDGKTGLIIEEKNIQALVLAMERMFIDNEFRTKCGIEARKKMENEYCLHKQNEKLINIYRTLI